MPVLSVYPTPAPAGSVITVTGSGFANAKTRLLLDGVGGTSNIFRPAKDGGFRVGITVAGSVKSQTLTAEQQTAGGSWKLVARLAPLLTFLPPSGADIDAPVVINQPTASNITSTSALISWSTNEPSTSVVDWGTTTSYLSGPTSNTALLTAHNVTLTGLSPSTGYHYRVRSTDAAGNQVTSADFTFTSAAVTDTTAPVIADIVATVLTTTSLQIAWDFNPADLANGQVKYGLTPSFGSLSTKETNYLASHRQVISGLTPGATYYYAIVSVDAAGNSAQSATQSVTMTAGSTVTLTAADTKATFITKTNDLTIDTIELASGTYTWQSVQLIADRTSNPLTIRPASGATVYFVGPATTDGTIFAPTGAKYVTFDGRPGGTGTASGMIFKDFAVVQSGVFQPSGTDHMTFRYLTFQNISRDATYSDQPYKSWCWYIYGSTNDNMLIEYCTFSAPAASRDISAIQIASSGSHGTFVIDHCTFVNYDYVFYCERQVTSVTLSNWTMTNCGNHPTPASIRFVGAFSMAGSYSNIVATSSDPYSDTHSGGGTITNGGGNSGI